MFFQIMPKSPSIVPPTLFRGKLAELPRRSHTGNKLFTNNNLQTIEFCRLQFNFKLPSEQIGYCKKLASSEFVSMNLANFSCDRLALILYIYFYR